MKLAPHIIVVLFIGTSLLAQQNPNLIKGKVYILSKSESQPQLWGVVIKNTSNNTQDITDDKGNFQIKVNLGDSLKITSSITKTRWLEISSRTIERQSINIFLNEEVIELTEATFGNLNFSGYLEDDLKNLPMISDTLTLLYGKLGFKPKDYEYLPDTTKFKATDGILFFRDLERISALISGDIRRNRNLVRYTKRQELVSKIIDYFEEDYFTNKLKIPANKIQEFVTFVTHQQNLKPQLKMGHYLKIQITLEQYASTFRDNLAEQIIN